MENTKIISYTILGLLFAVGLSVAGTKIGSGIERFRAEDRFVTVKGLAEKEVRADYIVWKILFEEKGSNLADAQKQFFVAKDSVLSFLKAKGFGENEISSNPTNISDITDTSRKDSIPQFRVEGEIVVKSDKVDLLAKTLGEVDELLQKGVKFTRTYETNPKYILRSFNDMRPELLAAATENARNMAEQFAKDSKSRVGRLRDADQGTIQIIASDGSYGEDTTLNKKLRVVSRVTFSLE